MKLAKMEVLSQAEIESIHDASLEVLEQVGVKMLSRSMCEQLAAKGLPVDLQDGIVKFPRSVLEDAIAGAPATLDVCDREGKPAFTLGDGESRIAAGHNAVFWVDSDTGATRPSTVEDVEQFCRICEQLECIDMIGIPVMPQDVECPAASLPYAVRAAVTHSRKPIFFSTDSAAVNRAAMEILRAGFAGDFDRQIYGISQLSPTSPLYWEESVLDAIVDTLQTHVPLAILPEPNAGVSAPYTLAGLLTVNNIECLSGLAMIQLLKPGHGVMYANSWTTSDMHSGAALVGSTETTICRIAAAQLARYYRVPSHTTAPNSDNHAHDEQSAWERTFSMFCSVGAGHDLVVNCGMFASGMTCSHEQLVMDEEISAMSKRIADGVQVTPDTIASDLIKDLGVGGNYMTTEHTLRWLYSEEYLAPRVSVRGPMAVWQAAGSADTYALAKVRARELSETPSSAVLDAGRVAAMDAIIADFETA